MFLLVDPDSVCLPVPMHLRAIRGCKWWSILKYVTTWATSISSVLHTLYFKLHNWMHGQIIYFIVLCGFQLSSVIRAISFEWFSTLCSLEIVLSLQRQKNTNEIKLIWHKWTRMVKDWMDWHRLKTANLKNLILFTNLFIYLLIYLFIYEQFLYRFVQE